jgi:glycosyltransferase 2 family protein
MRKQRLLDRRPVRQSAILVVFLLLLYVVVPQVGGLAHAWHVVVGANKPLLAAALLLLSTTYVVGACIYQALALRPLRFGRTLAVQVAGALAGKLLPAGIGSMGLNARYLQRNKHRAPEVVAVVGMNNLLGFGGYCVALLFASLAVRGQWPALHIIRLRPGVMLVAAGLFLLLVVLAWAYGRHLRARARRAIHGLDASLRQYARQPWKLVLALGLAALMPLLYSGILYLCARSLGLALSPAMAFMVFTAGLIVGTATPTPGGVGGAEAGLVAALVAYGFSTEHALLVALLYRSMTYWLPFAPGALVLWVIRGRYL